MSHLGRTNIPDSKSLNKPLQPEQCKQIADELLAAGLRTNLDRQLEEVQRAAADDQLASQANEILEIKNLVKNIEQRVKFVSRSTTAWDTRQKVIDLADDLQTMQTSITALRNYFETDGFERVEAPLDYVRVRGYDQRDDWDERRRHSRISSQWSAAAPVVTNLGGMLFSAVIAGLVASFSAQQGQPRRSPSPLPSYRPPSQAIKTNSGPAGEKDDDENSAVQEGNTLRLDPSHLGNQKENARLQMAELKRKDLMRVARQIELK